MFLPQHVSSYCDTTLFNYIRSLTCFICFISTICKPLRTSVFNKELLTYLDCSEPSVSCRLNLPACCRGGCCSSQADSRRCCALYCLRRFGGERLWQLHASTTARGWWISNWRWLSSTRPRDLCSAATGSQRPSMSQHDDYGSAA